MIKEMLNRNYSDMLFKVMIIYIYMYCLIFFIVIFMGFLWFLIKIVNKGFKVIK